MPYVSSPASCANPGCSMIIPCCRFLFEPVEGSKRWFVAVLSLTLTRYSVIERPSLLQIKGIKFDALTPSFSGSRIS